MSIEIEAKMRLDDIDPLIARLSEMGAEPGCHVIEVNRYFDTPEGVLRSADRGLRLRVENEIDGPRRMATITHKGPCQGGSLKIRSETEVGVENAAAAADLLESLGFLQVRGFEKRRRRWMLGDCEVDIDTVPYLGHFVEIEGPSEAAVLAVRRTLGLEAVPLVSGSYVSMLEAYVTEHRIASEYIAFTGDEAGR